MAKEPLHVYTCVPRGAGGYNASIYYRLELPLQTAEEMGLGVVPILDMLDSSVDNRQRIAAFYESDICLFYQPVGNSLIQHMENMQRLIPCKTEDGSWKWPPTVVVDTDDNLFDVNPLNGAFKELGIRMPSGEELKAGDEIGVVDGKGDQQVLYRDGVNGFNVADNRAKLGIYRKIMDLADAVTCSTRHTEAYVKKESAAKRTFIAPNCVRPDHYEDIDLAPHPDKVRILWQGSPTHHEDWFPLKDALGYLTRRYPQIEWVIWGAIYPWALSLVPPGRFRHIAWMPYQFYKLRLCTIGHDINLAPLSPTRFNMCRSAIKWYESSILKSPAATVAQNTGPYQDEIQDGETGLLFNDPEQFIEKVSLLVENATERKRIAANAKDWVMENRDAFKVVPKLVSYWRELREIKRQEKPADEEAWLELKKELDALTEEDRKKAEEEKIKTQALAAELSEEVAAP